MPNIDTIENTSNGSQSAGDHSGGNSVSVTARRQLLKTSLLALIGGCYSAVIPSALSPVRAHGYGSDIERAVSVLFADLDAAKTIGSRYLETYPAEHNRSDLCRHLSLSLGKKGNFKQNVESRISQDFADEDTVILDGWILSLTEVRLFALASFL